MQRHYGMDWLRIGAFALLILYHIGMVFVHWGYHVKLPQPIEWVAIPMLATNSWRLSLLFLVSGFASRMLLAKVPGAGRFAWRRTGRLLLPLIFGMAFIVPPQPWVELVTQHGYRHGFGWFWLHDYFRFGALDGIVLPTWNHLWFVAYLWVYTLGLALAFAIPWRGRAIRRGFDRLFSGWAVLLLPIGWELLARFWLVRGLSETHDLVTDPAGHAVYLPPFVFGVLLAESPHVMAALARLWKPAAALAIAGYAGVAWVEWVWPGNSVPPRWAIDLFTACRSVQAWAAIAALIGVADRFWNRDHRWRATLNEAIFPFYIAHQTIIVIVAFWLRATALTPLAQFGVLVLATTGGCWLFYLGGREIRPLRPLIGLRLRRPAARRRPDPAAVETATG